MMTNAAKDQGISVRKALHCVVNTIICSRYYVVVDTTLWFLRYHYWWVNPKVLSAGVGTYGLTEN